MKTLYLLRHAKSDKNNPLLQDIHRPLNERGYSDAYKISAHLRGGNNIPEKIITSPAVRTYSTAMIFLNAFSLNIHALLLNKKLYDTDMDTYLEEINSIEDTVNSVMLVGHNPIVSETASRLSGESLSFPTCAVMRLDFDVTHWNQLSSPSGKVLFFDGPKFLYD